MKSYPAARRQCTWKMVHKKDASIYAVQCVHSNHAAVSAEDPSAITIIHWNEGQGTLKKIKYHDGRILVEEPGYYYVYAKTCFRYAKDHDSEKVNVSNVQLLQYIFHEKHTQNIISPIQLTKSGGTLQWNIATYNMFCAEQGRAVQLNKGDGLYVSVSNFWLLDPAADGTYFGVFKISD